MNNSDVQKFNTIDKLKEILHDDEMEDEYPLEATLDESTNLITRPSQVPSTESSKMTKEDLVDNLTDLNTKAFEILEHLQDILLSELPDSKKITETSSVISNIVQINKTLYDIKFKDADDVKSSTAKVVSASFIKDIIDEIKKNK